MAMQLMLSDRDFELLRFLEITPATAAQIRKLSATFSGRPFRDERRVRERMQTLGRAGYTKTCSLSLQTGGAARYYRITALGYRTIYPDKSQSIPRSVYADLAPSRFQHTMTAADVIVHVLVSSHKRRVKVLQCHGDHQLTLEVGEYRQQPDCHFQLEYSGNLFNLLFEIDNGTEPIDSRREHSIRTKILGYEAYSDWVLSIWKQAGKPHPRPAFRVVFLTTTNTRANHILYMAQTLASNKDRRIVYASTQDVFLGEPDAVVAPIFNDHHGHWQSLVNSQPTANALLSPIRIMPPKHPIGII